MIKDENEDPSSAKKRGENLEWVKKKIIGWEGERARAIKGRHLKSREKDRGRQKQKTEAAAVVSVVAYFFVHLIFL